MFHGIISNIALIVALTLGYGLAIRSGRLPARINQTLIGFLFGCIAVTGMMLPVVYKPGIIFDGRSIIISSAGFIAGPIAAFVAAVLSACYRYHLGGGGAAMGVSVIFASALIGTAYYYLRLRNPVFHRPGYLYAFGIVVHLCMLGLTVLLPAGVRLATLQNIALPVILIYPLGNVAVCRFLLEEEQHQTMAAALRENERKYRELVENVNCIVLRWTRDGRITFINRFGREFFGYAEAELLGRHVVGTIVPESETTGRDLRSLMEDISARTERYERNINENMRRTGERMWIDWTNKIVFDQQRRVEEILSIGIDITDHKRAEEEIRTLNQSLERRIAERTEELKTAMEMAKSADRLKSAFLATMSHELRTPLNSIIGFTGILLQRMAGPLNEEQTRQLGMIQDSARHLLALINDVLDISKIEAGQLEIVKHPFDMRQVIEEVMQSVMPQAAKKGLALRAAVAPSVGTIVSDQRRVKQILFNLTTNAIKFTASGEVRVECRLNGDALETSVRDTGIGIAPQDMDKLFKPFRQIDTGLTRNHEGTGLGLAICKRLVELLGGAIHAESEPGKGSTFTFTLPAQGRAT